MSAWRWRRWSPRSSPTQVGWRAAFVLPGLLCVALGLAWLRAAVARGHRCSATHPSLSRRSRRHLVRRAVVVLLLIAVVSGLVFNAFTLLLPKLMQERLAGDARLLPLVGLAAFLATLCGALTQFTVGRMIDRTTLKRVFLPVSVVLAPGWWRCPSRRAGWCCRWPRLVAASIFGQVTVNETMTARYISPALRARMYSVRFFVGFLGAAAAAPAGRLAARAHRQPHRRHAGDGGLRRR